MRSAIIAAVAVAALAGCSSYDSVTQRIAQTITPYRITVVQGNFVSQEKASQLQVGMTRDQVRALLGTPLLSDMFHADRWDYLFYFKRGSTAVVQQRDLVLTFSGDRLSGWTGADNLPSELDLLADIDGDKRGKKAKPAATAAAASSASAAPATSAPAAAAVAVPEAARGQPRDQPGVGAGRDRAPFHAVRAGVERRTGAGRAAAGREPGDPAAVPVPSSAAAERAERGRAARRPAGLGHAAEPADHRAGAVSAARETGRHAPPALDPFV